MPLMAKNGGFMRFLRYGKSFPVDLGQTSDFIIITQILVFVNIKPEVLKIFFELLTVKPRYDKI